MVINADNLFGDDKFREELKKLLEKWFPEQSAIDPKLDEKINEIFQILYQGQFDELKALVKHVADLREQVAKVGDAMAAVLNLPNQIEDYEEKIKSLLPKPWKTTQSTPYYRYVDREAERLTLCTPTKRRYIFIVDAPPKYGKSALLKIVTETYEEAQTIPNVRVAQIDFSGGKPYNSSDELLKDLIQRFNGNLSDEVSVESLQMSLLQAVSPFGNILVIFDGVDRAEDHIQTYIQTTLISFLHKRLEQIDPPKPVRFILSGRYIIPRWTNTWSIDMTEKVQLHAFNVEVVRKELEEIYKEKRQRLADTRDIQLLARRIWYLGAGHPSLTASMLLRIRANPLLEAKDFQRAHYNEAIQHAYLNMEHSIPDELNLMLKKIAVLRHLDTSILGKFAVQCNLFPAGSPIQAMKLITDLRQVGLVQVDVDKETKYQGNIYRRLFLEYGLQNDPANLEELHNLALNTWESMLRDKETCQKYHAHRIILESLYHLACLHKSKEQFKKKLRTYLRWFQAAYLSGETDTTSFELLLDCAELIIARFETDYELQEEVFQAIDEEDFLITKLADIVRRFIDNNKTIFDYS